MSDSLVKRYEDNLLLSVETVRDYFTDETITDLYINPDGKLFVKQFGKSRQFTDRIIAADTVKRIINFTASMTGQEVNEKNPVLEAIMPYFDMRMEAVIPPWVPAPCICIRKKYNRVIPLQNWVNENRLTHRQHTFLENCIRERKNIIICGGTGSGKTTFLNSMIDTISIINPGHRLLLVEDTGEIICSALDYTPVCVPPESTRKAIQTAMRLYPDRIIFGELRYGKVAQELLKAWKTDHRGGLATIHADSARDVFSRIIDLLHEVIKGRITNRSLARVIHACVFLQDKEEYGPEVRQIVDFGIDKATKKLLYKQII